MNDGVTRMLATLTSVKRTRACDSERAEWTVPTEGVRAAVERLEADVGVLKAELALLDDRRSWRDRKAA